MDRMPILYSFRRCPYAMRARMALLASGTCCEIREVVLRDKPAEMIAASAKGTVPVLVLPGGEIIDESLGIMHWALGRNDPEGWLQNDASVFVAQNDGPFKTHLDRYKYPDRHGSDPLFHRAAGLEILSGLEQALAANGNLCGPRRSLADIAIMPFVRQFAATDQHWFNDQPLPALQTWLAGHITSPLFQQAMIRLKPWRAGDAPIFFPADASA